MSEECKQCNTCGQVKSLTAYYMTHRSKDSRTPIQEGSCKSCRNAASRRSTAKRKNTGAPAVKRSEKRNYTKAEMRLQADCRRTSGIDEDGINYGWVM